MGRKRYYLVLGVSRTESTNGTRQAFRELVKRYHPDRIGPQGQRFFQEIVEAYRQWIPPH
jgi:curved DNA-binding protein CbpA